MKEIIVDVKITEKSSRVLLDDNFVKVTIKFFWNAHGKLIPWQDNQQRKSVSHSQVHVTIVERVVSRQVGICEPYDSTEWTCYIKNDKGLFKYEVISFSGNAGCNLSCKCELGWG